MGPKNSKFTQLTNIINETTVNMLIQQSSKGSSTQSNTINISIRNNSGPVQFNRNTIAQLSQIDLSILQNAQVNADLQSQLVAKITAEIKEKKTDFPEINSSSDDTTISTTVRNAVAVNFKQESIASIMGLLANNVAIDISDNLKEVTANGNVIDQKTIAILKLVNTMSSDIATKLLGSTDASTEKSTTTTFFGADLVDSIGNAFSNIFQSQMLWILLIICVLSGVGYAAFKIFFSMDGEQQQILTTQLAGLKK